MYTKISDVPIEILLSLINQAKQKFTLIFPCYEKKFLFDCFTFEVYKNENYIFFWYNDVFNSTHLEKIKLS
jgi:hypothetical protein